MNWIIAVGRPTVKNLLPLSHHVDCRYCTGQITYDKEESNVLYLVVSPTRGG